MKMRVLLCCLAVVSCVAGGMAGSLPSYIKPCSAKDPHLTECIEKVIRDIGRQFASGIPELGIPTLDPVHLGDIPVDNPALKLKFIDTVVNGLGGFKLNAYKLNPEKGKAVLDFTANVTLKADYEMDGQILIIPIRGNGQTKIKILNLNIVVKYDYSNKNGHWVIDSYKDSYKMEKAHFKFTNLFNGNKQLADTLHEVVNTNWEPVIRDLAPNAFDHIILACVNKVKKLFEAVPADQLLLP